MSHYAFYLPGSGTSSTRTVTQIFEGTAAELAIQTLDAGVATVLIPDPYLPPDDAVLTLGQRWSITVHEGTGVVTHTAVARRSPVVAALLAARKANLKGDALAAFRLDRLLSDTSLADHVARITAIDALTSLSDPDPAPVTETNDPDGFRILDRLYRRGNIIGTVTRTALLGRVTGALIEEGANANGQYLRLAGGLAGGLQVCWHEMTSSASADTTWTLPAALASIPQRVGFILPKQPSGTSVNIVLGRDVGGTSWDFSILNNSNVRVARACFLIAIGRVPQA